MAGATILRSGSVLSFVIWRIVYNKAFVDTEAPLARVETEDICEFY